MLRVKVYYDQVGSALTVWFGETQEEYVAEETSEEVIPMEDKAGRVIGFEKLKPLDSKAAHLQVAFETVAT